MVFLVKTPKRVELDCEKDEILKKFHTDELYGAHSGQRKMYAKIRAHFYWPNMTKDISKYVASCHRCKLAKPSQRNKEELVITDTPQKPFDLVQIDTIGPLQESKNGNKYAVTLQCELTKYLVTIPTRGKTAAEVAKGIFEKFILIFGPMKAIKTDRGKEYENELIKNLCSLLKVQHSTSTAYHHQTLGMVERCHRTFNEYVRVYLEGMLDEWDIYAKYFTFAYNMNKNSSNNEQYSPYELVFAKNVTLPHEILNGHIAPVYNIDDYVQEARYRLQIAHEKAKETIEKIKTRSKANYDKTSKPIEISVGDIVKIVAEANSKFQDKYKGPYIVNKLEPPNVILQIDNKEYKIHKDRVRKYA